MTMIERVARAFCRAEGDEEDWDKCAPEIRDVYLSNARAAIEAMREPTAPMIAAWDSDFQKWMNHEIEDDDHLYKTMIDAALAEEV